MKAREQRGHEQNGDDVPREAEHRPREVSGAPRHVTLRAGQTVVPVRVVEVSEIHRGCLGQQSAFGLELNAPDEEIPSVAHIGAHGALNSGREPQAHDDREDILEPQSERPRRGDAIHQFRPEVHGNGRHGRAEHPEDRIPDQRLGRCRPGERHALGEVLSYATGPARGGNGGRVHRLDCTSVHVYATEQT